MSLKTNLFTILTALGITAYAQQAGPCNFNDTQYCKRPAITEECTHSPYTRGIALQNPNGKEACSENIRLLYGENFDWTFNLIEDPLLEFEKQDSRAGVDVRAMHKNGHQLGLSLGERDNHSNISLDARVMLPGKLALSGEVGHTDIGSEFGSYDFDFGIGAVIGSFNALTGYKIRLDDSESLINQVISQNPEHEFYGAVLNSNTIGENITAGISGRSDINGVNEYGVILGTKLKDEEEARDLLYAMQYNNPETMLMLNDRFAAGKLSLTTDRRDETIANWTLGAEAYFPIDIMRASLGMKFRPKAEKEITMFEGTPLERQRTLTLDQELGIDGSLCSRIYGPLWGRFKTSYNVMGNERTVEFGGGIIIFYGNPNGGY